MVQVRVSGMTVDFDAEAWERRIRQHRTEKDEFFASDPDSPIPEAERVAFDGLQYYPLEEAFRFEGQWEPRSSPQTVSLGATTGPDMEFEHIGNVGIEVEGDHTVLQVYRSPGVEDLLVPFRDQTNGSETWQHGRYLTVDPPSMEERTRLVLDFNVAYHPFCVYDESYICAIPPMENEIPTAIRAGERL